MSTLLAWRTFSAPNRQQLRQFLMTNFAIDFDTSTDNHPPEEIPIDSSSDIHSSDINRPILTAYIEPVYLEDWNIKPLPIRNSTSETLKVETFPQLNSCRKLPEQFPIDDPPTERDPYLPWIHDVFPTADGKFLQFIAQNRRRCNTGATFAHIKKRLQPNVALFQHVPVKRVGQDSDKEGHPTKENRYRLSSHADADKDGIETRFICRFKPSMEETLSVFNVDYDYHTWRKGYTATFTEEGFDNHMIWSSQLIFQCPIPPSLQETIRLGTSIKNDYATLFVDLIPIRTPPRYGKPTQFLQPKHMKPPSFIADDEWGTNHTLPQIKDSGRFENIPICKPSLMTYLGEDHSNNKNVIHDEPTLISASENEKKHTLVACAWTSTSFQTRGSRTTVTDGEQRLLQWVEFNKLIGVDHVYIYDNSGQFSKTENLEPVSKLFPGYVTRINWPAAVCNNNQNTDHNKGERSSQYAAESSCRLRFGMHSKWLMSVDTDEYVVPLGKHADLKSVLNKMEKEDIRILSFKSKRAKPRLQFLNTSAITDNTQCRRTCMDPSVREGNTFLEVYNCDIEKPPRKNTMPAEKQIYQTDYVKFHFVHYSTMTNISVLSKDETNAKGISFRQRYKEEHMRFSDEETEATMLHTKAIVQKETNNWANVCAWNPSNCKVGIPFPEDISTHNSELKIDVNQSKRMVANCYPHLQVDKYWVPKLKQALQKRGVPNR